MRTVLPSSHRADLVGASVATLCGVHCLVTPILVLALPALAGTWVVQERTEWGLLVAAVLLGVGSIAPGTLRGHRCLRPLALLAGGLGVLLLARLRLDEGSVASACAVVLGATLVAAAHLHNRRLLLARSRAAEEPAVRAAAAAARAPRSRRARP